MELLNKFKALIIAGVGVLLYLWGRKDEKIKQIDQRQKGQLNAINKVKVAQLAKYEPERIKRLHDKYGRR